MDVVATDVVATPVFDDQRFAVRGMTCSSCVRLVRQALEAVSGVLAASVDLETASATIRHDPLHTLDMAALQAAVAAAGYELGDASDELRPELAAFPRRLVRPFGAALLASAGLLAFYLAVITIAQDWPHALQQLSTDRWFVAAIAAGFGTQMGLFTFLRSLHSRATASGVAASTGTSTVGMLACCAHHLADIAPILGLSGAVVFLDSYKTPLLWLGIVMNLLGIIYLVCQLRRCQQPADCHPG
ncbi:MAG: cation transporter [Ardenticatenaceae bacterium]|nr:cation transporter [Ardenticatenaceae bacterium]HBY97625.1 hypothetical protein [Chloroflexota bacterium]